MDRRSFLAMPAAAATLPETPKYRVVSPFQPSGRFGMPGPYRGSVVSVKAEKSIDPQTETVDTPIVAEMIPQGLLGYEAGDPLVVGHRRELDATTLEIGACLVQQKYDGHAVTSCRPDIARLKSHRRWRRSFPASRSGKAIAAGRASVS